MQQSHLKQPVIRSGVVALGLLALEVEIYSCTSWESRNVPACCLERAWCTFLAASSGCS